MPRPEQGLFETQKKVGELGYGSLNYRQVDLRDAANLDAVIGDIAAEHQRLDGLIAAAGVQFVSPTLDDPPEKITEASIWYCKTLESVSNQIFRRWRLTTVAYTSQLSAALAR